MKTTLEVNKRKVTDWVNALEDEKLLDKVLQLMSESSTKPRYDAAYAATLTDEEKIAYWKEVGISGEESKRRLLSRIDQWRSKQ